MKNLFYSTLILAFFASCANKEPKLEKENAIATCFKAMDYKYETLLTKADIAKHIAIDEESYKMEISSTKGEYGSCTYEWKSNRPDLEMELLGQIIKYADVNRVELNMLTFYSKSELELYSQSSALSLFDQTYKKLSQEEYNQLLTNLEKEYANNPAGLATAKGFLDQRMQFAYRVQENLGDRAYWKWHEEHGIELVVLTGMVHFTIEAKVAATEGPALDAAVKFAQEVLAKCN